MRGMLWWLFLVTIVLPAHAAEPYTREQALRNLAQSDPGARRAAAARLGEVGQMPDVPVLLRALRDTDAQTRTVAESAIWSIWGHSGDRAIDALYRRGVEQMEAGEAADAIATFSEIIRRKPAFAEGWNKRATLYYTIGEFQKSLGDCAEVIRRNPQHFGALSGYGLIYVQLDQPELAIDYFKRALRINPNMPGVAHNIKALEKLLEDQRGRYI